MSADLHVHTSASDGASTPEQAVQLAAHYKLRCIAITDHDTLDGIPAAQAESKIQGIEILNGVELSTEIDGLEVHILGYCMDLEDDNLQQQLKIFQNARLQRAQKIIDKLRHLGFNISLEQVLQLAGPGSVGRPHIARVLLMQGGIKSIADAFDYYIGVGKPAYEPRLKFHPVQMIELIKSAGGVPVLAHPGISCQEPLILELIQKGLQGLEVYHPQHSLKMEQYYLDLCRKFNLVATGGSDFHGVGASHHGRLGDVAVPYETVTEIKDLAAKNRLNR